MQQRSIPMYIILSIVTCGLFGLYWFIVLTDETNEVTGQTQLASGPMALILTIITCNIYGWYWAYKMGEKVDMIKAQNGQSSSNSGILFIILQALGLGIVNYALAQDALNHTACGTYLPFRLQRPILCNKLSAVHISVYNTSKSISRLASTICVVIQTPVFPFPSEKRMIFSSSIFLCFLM